MAKKKPRVRKDSKRYLKYTVEGGKVIRPKSCPRCGPGVLLAVAKGRVHCGKCHYTEFADSNKKEDGSDKKVKKTSQKIKMMKM